MFYFQAGISQCWLTPDKHIQGFYDYTVRSWLKTSLFILFDCGKWSPSQNEVKWLISVVLCYSDLYGLETAALNTWNIWSASILHPYSIIIVLSNNVWVYTFLLKALLLLWTSLLLKSCLWHVFQINIIENTNQF